MAGLSLKYLRNGHVATFVSKMEEGVKTSKPEYMFTKTNGRKVILRTLQYNPGGRIVFYEITKHKKIITDLLSGTTSLPNLKFTDITGNETISLSDIARTEEFSGRQNKSDITELIYSAAVAARFYRRGDKPISVNDVEWVLSHMNDTNEKQKYGPWKIENEQRGVFDSIYWSFASPIMTVRTLSKVVNRKGKDIQAVIKAAVEYANSQMVKNSIAMTGKNNKSNLIEVKAIGSINTKDKNLDILVLVDGKKVTLNKTIVKTSSAQGGGGGYLKQQDLWSGLTGLDLPKTTIDAYSKTLKKGIPAAINTIFFDMAKILGRKLANINDPVYSVIGPGLSYLISMKDPLIKMPTLTEQQKKLLMGDNLSIALAISHKKLTCTSGIVSGIPTVIIKDTRGLIFLKITFRKLSGGQDMYINVIEKGPAFDNITHILK